MAMGGVKESSYSSLKQWGELIYVGNPRGPFTEYSITDSTKAISSFFFEMDQGKLPHTQPTEQGDV
jgi:hypothetical protein